MTSHAVVGEEERRGVGIWFALMPLVLLFGLLSGCSTPPERSEVAITPTSRDLIPKVEPRSRYGNPASYVVRGRRYQTKEDSNGHVERGVASWYGPGFHGRRTSSGERYDMYAMTAAHKTLPLPTYARVTNLENGRSAVVRINDRGPFHGPRVIDLSRAAAAKLGVLASGTAEVEVRALDPTSPEPAASNPFLLAANKPQPQSPSKSKSQAPAFLDGFEPSGPTAPSRQALAAEQPSKERQPLADATGSPARSGAAPVEVKPPRELVVAQRARPKPEATRAARRPEPLPLKEQVDVQVAKATDTKGAKGKVDPMETKPERAKPVVEASTKVAKADPAGSGMYLQVGAFGDRSNAENLRKRLSKELARLQVQVRSIGGDSSQLYKVQVGPLASRAKASDVSQQLAALGVTKSHMVVD